MSKHKVLILGVETRIPCLLYGLTHAIFDDDISFMARIRMREREERKWREREIEIERERALKKRERQREKDSLTG